MKYLAPANGLPGFFVYNHQPRKEKWGQLRPVKKRQASLEVKGKGAGMMKKHLRKAARKTKRIHHNHKRHLSFLEALRLYEGMPVFI
jgi:hypothetical protein